MSFSHIRGNEKALKVLMRIIKTRRLAHAYLFSGLEGIGKRLAAVAFSKTLLCSSGGWESCGSCSACVQVDQGNHPDLIMVDPQNGTTTIDSIRDFKRQLSRKSFAGGYKTCIIDNAEKMNDNAQNALLKTLEEPSPDTVIVLITAQPYFLLPTILSRCQQVKFQPLPISTAAEVVMEKWDVDRQTASLMVTLTGGSPGKALELKKEAIEEIRESLINHLCFSSEAERQGIFDLAEAFSGDKSRLDLKLNLLRLWYRDILLYKIYRNSDCLLNKDKAAEIASLSSIWSLENLLKALLWIEDYHQALTYNANPQLTMEGLFMKIYPKSEILLP